MSKRYHLFQGYGIELEYMIVDRQTMKVLPVSDLLLKDVLGEIGNDFTNGKITWSNELVLHVIELKTTLPEADLAGLNNLFYENINQINTILKGKLNAVLLPTAMHPLMNPAEETKIWPHDYNEVYEAYNKMFNCKGHGWSNVQSMHINLPFYDDEEFSQLHDAVRLVLPLIPALAASSPIYEGNVAENIDQRLAFYKMNQAVMPAIAGNVIPELVHSKRQYNQVIYENIRKAVAPHDKKGILDPIWVNSRGAIARFDRGSIEIRLIDIQECPLADLAIASFLIELIKWLDRNRVDGHNLKAVQLAPILNKTIKKGQEALIEDQAYLSCFGVNEPIKGGELLKLLFLKLYDHIPAVYHSPLKTILFKGNLSSRILKALGDNPTKENIIGLYQELAECLEGNKLFVGKIIPI